jgi:crotonobetainyl-CoA:carnitine CoA-transferase CaiB-like acyl-CoA transferase
VRILAVEQYGAGPFGTQVLADLGADVIKIEDPASGGDVARTVGPYFTDALPETAQSYFFQGLNRGKKSVSLNLAHPEGRAVFERLVANADAVASNLRGDVPQRLGLTFESLSAFNPKIVCGHLTGYGRSGERADWPGYDYLMQAETGYFHLTGDPDGPPSRMGLSLVDLMTGVALGLGLVSAVMSARATGRGRDIDVSLFDMALFNLNYVGHWYLNAGAVTTRLPRSAHPSLTPCQTYRTRDGWIYLMCNKEKFWGVLCEQIGRAAWTKDPRFLKFPDRLRNRAQLTPLLDEALGARTTAEWMERFAGQVPAAPILDVGQALDNPFVADSDRIEKFPLEDGTTMRLLASPIRASGPLLPERRAPALGEDTDAILAEAGICAAEIHKLRRDGVIR